MNERTVLFVDDDGIVLRSIARDLWDEPYNICFAKSGKEALDVLRQQEIHVLVTDMRMPEMDGAQLLTIVTKEYAHIVKMVLSGYTNIKALTMTLHQSGIFRFIPKPWNVEEGEDFRTIIRGAIEHYNLQSKHAETVAE